MAREIQLRLLPQVLPTLRGAEVAARFTPARTIGGDMYEFLQYSGDSTAIMIGDVSGKGAPAASTPRWWRAYSARPPTGSPRLRRC